MAIKKTIKNERHQVIHPITDVEAVEGLNEALAQKQDVLNSGVNIKTINGESILGAGNIIIDGGGHTIAVDTEMSLTSENPVQNKVITEAISEFITSSVDNLINYYLKSETYSKTEIDSLISAISQFSYEVAASLPEASGPTMYKIYLVPSSRPETQNVKDEYITIRSGSVGSYTYAWEQIGSTAIDLSGYVTTTALNAALATKQDVISDLATIRSGAASGATAYQKPASGIPKTDLSSDVQDSLELADTAVQADPVGSVTPPVTPSDWATAEQVEELDAKVDDLSTGKYYGYFATSADLPDDATVDGFAYVGEGPTYTIYNCVGGMWTSSGITVNQSPIGNDEDIDQNEDGKLQFANRTYNVLQPNGMGYKILRKDATFASQVTDANTIYEVRYDFDLSANLTLPSGSYLKFVGGTINPNGYTISGAIANEYIMPEWFGAKGDGVTDDSDAFNAVVALVNGGSNGRIYLQKKHYLIKNQLAFRNDIDIIGNGATLDFQKDGMFACVEISKETPLSALNVGTISGTKGESTITVSDASEISSGDFVILYDTTADSWSSESNRDYHCGDIFKVVSVNGTTIGVSEPLTQDYSGASIVLYKLQTIKASISDLCVIGDFVDGSSTKTLTPILARCCVESSFKNLYLTNSNITHLSLIYCYGVVVDNVKVDTDSTTTNVNTNYGITVGCCKKVDVGNCVLKSHRHGLTIGGGETLCFPNRYILVHDCIFDTYGTVTNAIDSHGNAEYITFADNVVIGGITCSASNFVIKGNRIFSKKGLQAGIYLVNARYRTGTIQDNEIHWYASANGDCGISIYTNSDADNDAELLIDGNRFLIDAVNAELTAYCADIYFRNGTTYKYKRLIISNNVFHYGTFNLCFDFFANSSLADYLVFERNECRDFVQLNQTAGISESIIQDNNFEKLGGSCLTINNGGTKTTIRKNHFVTDNYAITFGGTTQNTNTIFIVDGNFFDITMAAAGRAAVISSKSGKTVFVNNTVYSPTVGGASLYLNDIYATNSAELVCKSNKFYVASKVKIYDATTVTTVKRDVGGTAGRNAMLPGDTYFDTDLGKMIVWNGTAWVNMDGTALS